MKKILTTIMIACLLFLSGCDLVNGIFKKTTVTEEEKTKATTALVTTSQVSATSKIVNTTTVTNETTTPVTKTDAPTTAVETTTVAPTTTEVVTTTQSTDSGWLPWVGGGN